MDGNTLLQYARFREDKEGDFGRIRRQQQVIKAISAAERRNFNIQATQSGWEITW